MLRMAAQLVSEDDVNDKGMIVNLIVMLILVMRVAILMMMVTLNV